MYKIDIIYCKDKDNKFMHENIIWGIKITILRLERVTLVLFYKVSEQKYKIKEVLFKKQTKKI